MTTETYEISEYQSTRHPGELLMVQDPDGVSMQTLTLAALVLTSGAQVERVTLCTRGPQMPYDVVIECRTPEQVHRLQPLIGGVLRQAWGEYDHTSPTQLVHVWLDGEAHGVSFRVESQMHVAPVIAL